MKTRFLAFMAVLLVPTSAAAEERASLDDRQWHFSAQLDLSALTLEDDGLDQEGAATLGGFGVSARLDFPLRAGVEVGFSGVHRRSRGGLVDESVFVQSFSGLWYFWRSPDLRFFALTGLSSLSTHRQVGAQSFRFEELGLHAGAGAEIVIGHWLLTLDARVLGLANDTAGTYGERSYSEGRSPYPSRWASLPPARGGSRATVAFGYRF